ncbi:MAG: polysaccharide biosynthesis protein, partial [Clostridia bacterium]|nr:polysaccharide biosynthesis protein [Clostridia bacterium]
MKKIDNAAPRIGDFFKVRWLLVLYDFILFAVMGVCMTFLYKHCIKTPNSHKQFLLSLLVIYGVLFVVRFFFKIYRQIWRYGGVESYIRMYLADTIAGVIYYLGERLLGKTHVSFIWLLSIFCVNLLLTLFTRLGYRYLYKNYNLYSRKGRLMYFLLRILTLDKIKSESAELTVGSLKKINIAIVGAGNTGVALAGELKNIGESPYYPVLFIDISAEKIGRIISGIPVISEKEATPARIAQYEVQEIVFALPHLSETELTELYTRYSSYGVKIKAYDYPLMRDAENSRRMVRELDVEELLFRRQSLLADETTAAYYKGKTVLITGGGGSIGSELCRQLAQMEAGHIIVLDVYENGAYDIQQELQMKYGSALKVSVEIASVCNR